MTTGGQALQFINVDDVTEDEKCAIFSILASDSSSCGVEVPWSIHDEYQLLESPVDLETDVCEEIAHSSSEASLPGTILLPAAGNCAPVLSCSSSTVAIQNDIEVIQRQSSHHEPLNPSATPPMGACGSSAASLPLHASPPQLLCQVPPAAQMTSPPMGCAPTVFSPMIHTSPVIPPIYNGQSSISMLTGPPYVDLNLKNTPAKESGSELYSQRMKYPEAGAGDRANHVAYQSHIYSQEKSYVSMAPRVAPVSTHPQPSGTLNYAAAPSHIAFSTANHMYHSPVHAMTPIQPFAYPPYPFAHATATSSGRGAKVAVPQAAAVVNASLSPSQIALPDVALHFSVPGPSTMVKACIIPAEPLLCTNPVFATDGRSQMPKAMDYRGGSQSHRKDSSPTVHFTQQEANANEHLDELAPCLPTPHEDSNESPPEPMDNNYIPSHNCMDQSNNYTSVSLETRNENEFDSSCKESAVDPVPSPCAPVSNEDFSSSEDQSSCPHLDEAASHVVGALASTESAVFHGADSTVKHVQLENAADDSVSERSNHDRTDIKQDSELSENEPEKQHNQRLISDLAEQEPISANDTNTLCDVIESEVNTEPSNVASDATVATSAPNDIATSACETACTEENTVSTFFPNIAAEKSATVAPITSTDAVATPPSGVKTWASLFKGKTSSDTTVVSVHYSAEPLVHRNEAVPARRSHAGYGHTSGSASKLPPKTFESYNKRGSAPAYASKQSVDKATALRNLGDALLDAKLDHRCCHLQPRGLVNKGNWCYINATLQALLACPPFYNLMHSLRNVRRVEYGSESATPVVDSLVEFVNSFKVLPHISQAGKQACKNRKDDQLLLGSEFEPTHVYNMLSIFREDSFRGHQEDAEEFLGFLLNTLHEEMVAALKVARQNSGGGEPQVNGEVTPEGTDSNGLTNGGDQDWIRVGPKNVGNCITQAALFDASPISNIFGGQVRSAVLSSTVRATLQLFFSLQLEIQSTNVTSVQDALEGFVRREELQGFISYKTKQEEEASRQMTFEELPIILILHLKCFVYDKEGGSGSQKVIKQIMFPIDLELNKDWLSPEVKSKYQTRQRFYKLFAVIYHSGKEIAKGHYITDIYHSGTASWLRCDDSQITHIHDSDLHKYASPRMPYLLYYRRVDTVFPSK